MSKLLSFAEKESIAERYKSSEVSQADLAIEFKVSRTTIRRALHEFGLSKMDSEASTTERSLLETIKAFGIDSTERLRDVLNKGVQC